MLKKIKKSEKGSITILVLTTMLVVVGVILFAYMIMMNKSSSQERELDKIQEEYNKTDDMMSQAYSETLDEEYFKETSTIDGKDIGTALNPTIPAGFRPVDTDTSKWGKGTEPPKEEDVNNGLVIEDKEGNQFVWIPVTGEYKQNINYKISNVTAEVYTDTGYLPEGIQPETDVSESNEQAEREAVLSKGGFYISRYEAGKETIGDTNKLVSKAGATVWNYISQEDCKKEAKKFINNDNVKSALCSGIQWDMTMNFVNGKNDGEGEKIDVTVNGDRGGSSPATSGQSPADKMCNIFDLEGNYCEYVAEKSSYSDDFPFVYRGGYYGSSTSASGRGNLVGSALSGVSFRFTLYVM